MTRARTPSIIWTARVPHHLAEQVETAMVSLGLTNHTEAVMAALRLLVQHAPHVTVAATAETHPGVDAAADTGADGPPRGDAHDGAAPVAVDHASDPGGVPAS